MLLAIGVTLGVLIVLFAICVCIEFCCPSGDEQVDEENPRSLYQSREARESERRGFGFEDLVYWSVIWPVILGDS
jgi:beta-lactam-binding protein with PASTA domain